MSEREARTIGRNLGSAGQDLLKEGRVQTVTTEWKLIANKVNATVDKVKESDFGNYCKPKIRKVIEQYKIMNSAVKRDKGEEEKYSVNDTHTVLHVIESGKNMLNELRSLMECILRKPLQQQQLGLQVNPLNTQQYIDRMTVIIQELSTLKTSLTTIEGSDSLITNINAKIVEIEGKKIEENIQILEQCVSKFEREASNLRTEVVEFKEDKTNAVRVFVRARPDKMGMIRMRGDGNVSVGMTTVGPFFNTYDENFNTNKKVFDSGISDVLNHLRNKNVIIGAYGLSGTGKTSFIAGRESDLGIIQQSVDYMDQQLKLKFIFEDTYVNTENEITAKGVNLNINLKGGLVLLYGDSQEFRNLMEGLEFEREQVVGIEEDTSPIDYMRLVGEHRKIKKRIIPTANNPESSRSHLFVVCETQHGTKLTFIDMAGKETPQQLVVDTVYPEQGLYDDVTRKDVLDVVRLFLRKSVHPKQFMSAFKTLESRINRSKGEQLQKDKSEDLFKHIILLIKQAIYICSGLTDLKMFCQRRAGKDVTGKYTTNPNEWTTDDTIFKPENSLMNKILRKLSSAENKPKIVLTALVRGEEQYSQDTLETLRMCDGISSTNISNAGEAAVPEGMAGPAGAGEAAGEAAGADEAAVPEGMAGAGEAAGEAAGAYRFIF